MNTTGAYPTMITPYNSDGSIDTGAVKALTDWYWSKGCDGVFASCQSSEIFRLTLSERVTLARTVKEEAMKLASADNSRGPMTVVASGHISDGFSEQVKELNEMASTGIDALILISNRINIENTSEKDWNDGLDRLIGHIDSSVPLGIYECPYPYKRLLSDGILKHVTETGRFAFIKDTCCNAGEIAKRVKLISDTAIPENGLRPALFNANGQTLLATLQSGAAGYCGIMANFHPELYVWLCKNFALSPEKAEVIGNFLCSAAFIESLPYPCIAKYHLDKTGVKMNISSRSCDEKRVGEYEKMCVDNMEKLAGYFRGMIRADN